MASNEENERRLNSLERETQKAMTLAEDAHHLAVGADRDVAAFMGKLNMHKKLLVALRDTQIEQGRDIKELRQETKDIRVEIKDVRSEMYEGFTEMREGFAKLAVGQAQITALLTRDTDDK
jgi:hypothetical protein